MSKANRNKNRARAHERQLSARGPIPESVSNTANYIINNANADVHLSLRPMSYAHFDTVSTGEYEVEIGSIDRATPTLSKERHRKVVAIIDALARFGQIDAQRFDIQAKKLVPISLKVSPSQGNGNFVYMPPGTATYKSIDGKIQSGAFTKYLATETGNTFVSFVSSDTAIRPHERASMATTEMAQNRLRVGSLVLDSGKVYEQEKAVDPFQESIANGIGNILGSIAIGETYKQYHAYMIGPYAHTNMFGNEVPKNVFGGRIHIIAPHVMFDAEAYDQLAAGEVPSAMPQITSIVHPGVLNS